MLVYNKKMKRLDQYSYIFTKIIKFTIEDGKEEHEKKIAFVNYNIIIHLIDLDKKIPKFMI